MTQTHKKIDLGLFDAFVKDALASFEKLPDRHASAQSKLAPGQMMPDGTIYVGQYKPKFRDGTSLNKTFNVFAAAQNLDAAKLGQTYLSTVISIAGIKNLHGYAGEKYKTDEELYAAIENNKYSSGWIIPPIDILDGKDHLGHVSMHHNLFAQRNTPDLKNIQSGGLGWQWSSTCGVNLVVNVNMHSGARDKCHKGNLKLACRPVRLVEVKP